MKTTKIEELDQEHDHEFLDPELDPYPACDPDLIGGMYGGDCCPRCGEALKIDENVVRFDGEEGVVINLGEGDVSIPLYHISCYRERMAGSDGQKQGKLEDYK